MDVSVLRVVVEGCGGGEISGGEMACEGSKRKGMLSCVQSAAGPFGGR